MTTDELRVKILRDITAFQPAQAEVPTHVKDNLLLLLDMVEGGGGAAGGIGTNAPPHYVIMTYDHAEKLIKTAMSIRDLNAWIYQYFAPRNTMREYDILFRDQMGVILHAGVAPIIRSIVVDEARGKFYVTGAFDTYNGATQKCVMAFHMDGIPDAAYNANIPAQFNIFPANKPGSGVIQAALQSDGKLVIIANFELLSAVPTVGPSKCIGRFNIDGTLDEEFMATIGDGLVGTLPISMAVLENDDILVSCTLTGNFDGTPTPRLVKLKADGTLDTAYLTALGTGFDIGPNALAQQADGKVLCGGSFTTFNAVTVPGLVRLNVDGTRDNSLTVFSPIMTGSIHSIAIQPDQKILLGCLHSTVYDGTDTHGLLRLNPNGTVDGAFTANRAADAMQEGTVYSVAVQPNGKILIATDCDGWGAIPPGAFWSALRRLLPTGAPDNATFNPPNTGFDLGSGGSSTLTVKLYTIAVQPDGRVLVGGEFAGYDGDPAPNGLFRLLENLPTDGVVPPVI